MNRVFLVISPLFFTYCFSSQSNENSLPEKTKEYVKHPIVKAYDDAKTKKQLIDATKKGIQSGIDSITLNCQKFQSNKTESLQKFLAYVDQEFKSDFEEQYVKIACVTHPEHSKEWHKHDATYEYTHIMTDFKKKHGLIRQDSCFCIVQ